ncbi:dihydrofolate reductase [Labrys miyagiensis]|uniref:Dihydrofolate reductase n=1 Tax=Labrys miyagiensis TaxID=346912 RepID=A0ABQ6CNC0_9HYPH|nr:dihydrofolate reductase [Labrys miyagiensis]GLS21315.1 dihydrofolate reductase [Labrys miyagiensis]
MPVPVIMVAAMARNRVIGVDNGLPWHMRSDLRQFKAATMGKPLIMGRKTYQSIGRPLPGRRSIVVTHDKAFIAEGVEVADSIEAALARGQEVAAEMGADAIVVAGGATIYQQALAKADRLLLTELDLEAKGDAVFPAFSSQEWQEISRVAFPRGEGDDASFAVVSWQRR